MKKILALLLLLPVLALSVLAADVASMVEELPAVNVLREMDMKQQKEVYDRTQAAYDAYMALSDGEKAEIPGAEDTFGELFGYFNTLTMPLEEILKHAYEYVAREDILLSLEYSDLSAKQAKALLQTDTPLADIFTKWEKRETDHMTDIWDTVESRAAELLRQSFLAAQREGR